MQRTTVAVLGTLAEFHRKPIPYDLAALVRLVRAIQPDLLCLDMTAEQWQHKAFDDLPPEYSAALLPLAEQTDIVVVPIGGTNTQHLHPPSGVRAAFIAALRRYLAVLQESAPGADAVNTGVRHFVADTIYGAITWLSGPGVRRAQADHTAQLVRAALSVARRDPGRRVLVAVNVQHCHHIRRALRHHAEMSLVDYKDL